MEKLEYHLQVFDGPLDLLLTLIAKNKLDIYDIPIAELLEQYMEQIALMREANLDVASEFLEMAARLVQIKAASLLPKHEDEEDPRAELTGQLLEYEQCKRAAARLGEQCSFDRLVRLPSRCPWTIPTSGFTIPGKLPRHWLPLGEREKVCCRPSQRAFPLWFLARLSRWRPKRLPFCESCGNEKPSPTVSCLLENTIALNGWPRFWRSWSW